MSVVIIPFENIILSFVPLLIVLFIFVRWGLNWKELIYAATRMLCQLLFIGYFLSYIFKQNNPWWTTLMLAFMLSVSAWISLHSVKRDRMEHLKKSVVSLVCGALPVLLLVVIVIIPTTPWYAPRFIIPLAGMVFCQCHEYNWHCC